MGRAVRLARDGIPLSLDIAEPQLWEPESPVLYDLELLVTSEEGTELDRVSSYAGLRETHIEGNRVFLNGTPRYLRLVLDQGFYPDGIWTAPSDGALRHDIELAQAAGFNGARLHQKVFEERFLYWADRLGYLLWGESPSWGLDVLDEGAPHRNFLAEWREIVRRDRNHPSIIAWTPFNETHDVREPRAHQRIHEDAYAVCKSLDPTRPVNDASGYVHHVTDLYTVHTYEQDPARLAGQLADRPGAGPVPQPSGPRCALRGAALPGGRVRRHQVGPGHAGGRGVGLGPEPRVMGLRAGAGVPGGVLTAAWRAWCAP